MGYLSIVALPRLVVISRIGCTPDDVLGQVTGRARQEHYDLAGPNRLMVERSSPIGDAERPISDGFGEFPVLSLLRISQSHPGKNPVALEGESDGASWGESCRQEPSTRWSLAGSKV